MAKLITVVGNSGIGKTTLARILSQKLGLLTGLEEHISRPFQSAFKNEPRYALANQIDYLLLRVEQETSIRSSPNDGILDGGMEMDFHVFSRLFLIKKWLSDAEFSLLERLYHDFRRLLPPPDVIVYMDATIESVTSRFQSRGRSLEIATIADLQTIGQLLRKWIDSEDPGRVIRIDANKADPAYQNIIEPLYVEILKKIEA